MELKYKFSGETMNYEGHTLRRIKRCSDGKLGGWIETRENLSQSGGCWVGDEAKVYGNAKVCLNAKVLGNACVYDNVFMCGDTHVYGDSRIYGNARLYDSAEVSGNAQIYGNATLYGNARVYGNARIYDDAMMGYMTSAYGDARLYENAQLFDKAQIYGDVRVYGRACVFDNAKIHGEAKVWGQSYVYGKADVCGQAKIYNAKVDYSTSGAKNDFIDETVEVIKDFVYKINDLPNLNVQMDSTYDSIDAFFEDERIESYLEHEYLAVIDVDTKNTILKIEKTQVKDMNAFRLIIDFKNEYGDNYSVTSIINSRDKFKQILESTVDSLHSYPQFEMYARKFESCL